MSYSHLGEINPFPGPHTFFKIPNKYIGLVVGKSGDTIRQFHSKTGCKIFVPKESQPGHDFRFIELSGSRENIEDCKQEIDDLISTLV